MKKDYWPKCVCIGCHCDGKHIVNNSGPYCFGCRPKKLREIVHVKRIRN